MESGKTFSRPSSGSSKGRKGISQNPEGVQMIEPPLLSKSPPKKNGTISPPMGKDRNGSSKFKRKPKPEIVKNEVKGLIDVQLSRSKSSNKIADSNNQNGNKDVVKKQQTRPLSGKQSKTMSAQKHVEREGSDIKKENTKDVGKRMQARPLSGKQPKTMSSQTHVEREGSDIKKENANNEDMRVKKVADKPPQGHTRGHSQLEKGQKKPETVPQGKGPTHQLHVREKTPRPVLGGQGNGKYDDRQHEQANKPKSGDKRNPNDHEHPSHKPVYSHHHGDGHHSQDHVHEHGHHQREHHQHGHHQHELHQHGHHQHGQHQHGQHQHEHHQHELHQHGHHQHGQHQHEHHQHGHHQHGHNQHGHHQHELHQHGHHQHGHNQHGQHQHGHHQHGHHQHGHQQHGHQQHGHQQHGHRIHGASQFLDHEKHSHHHHNQNVNHDHHHDAYHHSHHHYAHDLHHHVPHHRANHGHNNHGGPGHHLHDHHDKHHQGHHEPGHHSHGFGHHDTHHHGYAHGRHGNHFLHPRSGSSKHRSKFGGFSGNHCGDCCSVCSPNSNVALENTFKTDPESEFKSHEIRPIIKQVMEVKLKDRKYDPVAMQMEARVISDLIKTEIKAFHIARYKLICLVFIGQGKSQSVQIASRCLWDQHFDNFASETVRFDDFFATAMVFATFYE